MASTNICQKLHETLDMSTDNARKAVAQANAEARQLALDSKANVAAKEDMKISGGEVEIQAHEPINLATQEITQEESSQIEPGSTTEETTSTSSISALSSDTDDPKDYTPQSPTYGPNSPSPLDPRTIRPISLTKVNVYSSDINSNRVRSTGKHFRLSEEKLEKLDKTLDDLLAKQTGNQTVNSSFGGISDTSLLDKQSGNTNDNLMVYELQPESFMEGLVISSPGVDSSDDSNASTSTISDSDTSSISAPTENILDHTKGASVQSTSGVTVEEPLAGTKRKITDDVEDFPTKMPKLSLNRDLFTDDDEEIDADLIGDAHTDL